MFDDDDEYPGHRQLLALLREAVQAFRDKQGRLPSGDEDEWWWLIEEWLWDHRADAFEHACRLAWWEWRRDVAAQALIENDYEYAAYCAGAPDDPFDPENDGCLWDGPLDDLFDAALAAAEREEAE